MAAIIPDKDAKAAALALLEAGEVVAIPTETVYGLAGDAANGRAVARIFEAKGRPRFNPLIAHVSVAGDGRADRAVRSAVAEARRRVLAGAADAGAAASRQVRRSIRWSPRASTRSRCACRRVLAAS